MNTPDPVESAPAVPPPANGAPRPWFRRPALAIVAAAVALLAVQWYDNHQQINVLQQELARQLASAEADNRDSRGLAEQAGEAARDSQSRLAALDTRYQELSRSRDDEALAAIEQALLLANQQLRMAGDARTALNAMQAIDARLARLDAATFATLRKAVARDIERLKAAPQADIATLAARLDDLAAAVDVLPLVADTRPPEAAAARKAAPADNNVWVRLAREFWQDLRDLVRIQKIDNAEALPLAPSQAYFLRETLRLRLLGARIALLAHNDRSYRADLKAAREWLARYFDAHREPVATALATLRQLYDSPIDAPDLAASVNAVRNLRAAQERR